jgi:tRNA G18 (ribose-2'-O)-methylase SpoU
LQVRQLVCCGTAKLLNKVARDAVLLQDGAKDDTSGDAEGSVSLGLGLWFKVVNTLRHPLLRFKEEGYEVVGLEQTAASTSLYDFRFARKTVLVIGSENKGIPPDILAVCDRGACLSLSVPFVCTERLW